MERGIEEYYRIAEFLKKAPQGQVKMGLLKMLEHPDSESNEQILRNITEFFVRFNLPIPKKILEHADDVSAERYKLCAVLSQAFRDVPTNNDEQHNS